MRAKKGGSAAVAQAFHLIGQIASATQFPRESTSLGSAMRVEWPEEIERALKVA